MRICKHDEPEKRQPTTVLMLPQVPALQSVMTADESAAEEAQWEAYLTELTLLRYGECSGGCDWTDGALSSEGCHW